MPIACLLDRCARPRLDNAYNGNVERTLGRLERRRRRGIAGDYDQLHVQANEVADDLEGEPPDLGEVAYPVRYPGRVPKVDGVLVGKPIPDL